MPDPLVGGHLLLVHGPSGSVNSTLLDEIQRMPGFRVRLLSKFTTRPTKPEDRRAAINSAPDLPATHDIRYVAHNNQYGISSKEIDAALSEASLAVAIISDLDTLRALKVRYLNHAVVAYLQRDAPSDIFKSHLLEAGFGEEAITHRWRPWEASAASKDKHPELFDLTLHNSGSPSWLAEQIRAYFQVIESQHRPLTWKTPEVHGTRIQLAGVSTALKETLANNPELLYQLHHRDFEQLVAELLADSGYDEVTVTPGSRDGGFDILAVRHDLLGPLLFLVECKRYAREHKVGVQPVRDLYAVKTSLRASAAALVTTSYFTSGAENFAQKVGFEVALNDYDRLVDLLGRYKRAR